MIKSYAKINIGLQIWPKNNHKDNKHKLKSIFHLYKKLYDEITINTINSCEDKIIYYQNQQAFNVNDCLLSKTLKYLRNKKLINDYYRVEVYKNIPIGAGLGGASSNAACIIKTLVNYKLLDPLDIALELGSDIPFFLYGYDWALVEEYGNKVSKLDINTHLNLAVVFYCESFSTKTIFQQWDNLKKLPQNNHDFNKIINSLNADQIPWETHNDLADVVKLHNHKWNLFYESQKQQNDYIIMSGSGGTIVTMNTNKRIRTRYAPSPTGYFHIGGARTAIFNYLYAKHNKGDFVVRIEDTDMERSVENGIESQLDNLDWLNITPDESIKNPKNYGPYIQSEKLAKYETLAKKLLQDKKAYYCFCDSERLEASRKQALENHQTPKYDRHCLHLDESSIQQLLNKNTPYVIRLKIDSDKHYTWNDLIRGEIAVPGSAMTDPVILKSNGVAMYNFAVVVDDYDMDISHVLRGEEHISNTPYQLAIAEALDYDLSIQYGHLSVIIDESGKKLSKRNKAMKQFIEDYKLMGFIPASVFNFLALLSWNSKDNQEIMNQDEFISKFTIDQLSKSPTFFDFNKMLWIGNQYFKKMDESSYIKFVKPFVHLPLSSFLQEHINEVLLLFKNQISYANQLNDLIQEQIINEINLVNDDAQAIVSHNLDVVNEFAKQIANIQTWTPENITLSIDNTKQQTNKKGKDLFMPIRIASTGIMHGPELAKTLYLKQQATILMNIDKIIKNIK